MVESADGCRKVLLGGSQCVRARATRAGRPWPQYTLLLSPAHSLRTRRRRRRGGKKKPVQAAESGASFTFRIFHPVVPFLILVYLYIFFFDIFFPAFLYLLESLRAEIAVFFFFFGGSCKLIFFGQLSSYLPSGQKMSLLISH